MLYLHRMPVQVTIPYDHGHFFITYTCYKWLPLIKLTSAYDEVYKWFDYLKNQGHLITAYVIMPNHIHVTIAFRKSNKKINSIIGDGKRFLSYFIVKKLTVQREYQILQILSSGVSKREIKNGKIHKVWEDSFDWKECRSTAFSKQKIDYIHFNPCKGRWNLATSIIEYPHSSARYYITGEPGLYEVTHYNLLEDIDLSKFCEI
jgi:REP element-mobilizing transposase RayT